MKIYEITQSQLVEQFGLTQMAPGALKAVAGMAGRAIIDKITGLDTQSLMSPGKIDSGALETATDQLALKLNQQWPLVVNQVMSQTKNPRTGAVGVTDFREIDKRALALAFNKKISELVGPLSKNRFRGINDIMKIPQTKFNPDQLRVIQDQQRKINAATRLLLGTNPGGAGAEIVKKSWRGLINSVLKLTQILSQAQTGGLAAAKITKVGDRVSLDGRVLDPANAQDAAMLASLQAQGLMPR